MLYRYENSFLFVSSVRIGFQINRTDHHNKQDLWMGIMILNYFAANIIIAYTERLIYYKF